MKNRNPGTWLEAEGKLLFKTSVSHEHTTCVFGITLGAVFQIICTLEARDSFEKLELGAPCLVSGLIVSGLIEHNM